MMVSGQDELTASRTGETYRADWTTYENPSTAIVEAVAQALRCDQTDLDALYEHVDGDAVDRLLRDADTRVEISFEYQGVQVTADSTGRLQVK